jgi:hypothetical protein
MFTNGMLIFFLAERQEPRKMVSDMPKETPEWQGSNQT